MVEAARLSVNAAPRHHDDDHGLGVVAIARTAQVFVGENECAPPVA
jgi:hypothetical protein